MARLSRRLLSRQAVAAILTFALVLAGIGRGIAPAAAGASSSVVIAGVSVSLCALHDGSGGDPAGHGAGHGLDCDQCPLCAPAMMPVGAVFSQPVRIERIALLTLPAPPGAIVAPVRTPRLSQGPPFA